MKKIIPALVAIVLIIIIGGLYAGKIYLDKYSYSDERVNLDEYFDVNSDLLAIILEDDNLEEKALMREGECYLSLSLVKDILSEIYYCDFNEELLLYTNAVDTIKTSFGANSYTDATGEHQLDYTTCFAEGDELYVALDYVKLFNSFLYEITERKLQLYTSFDSYTLYEVKKDTAVRERGGVKSAILRDLAAGETVQILEKMENWSKVKTADSFIGYVENKKLSEGGVVVARTPDTDYVAPEYTCLSFNKKVNLGWHAIGGVMGNDTLQSAAEDSKGMNVIAPTWFSVNDNAGGFRDFSQASYVTSAHNMGYQVWGVLDDFNYKLDTNSDISILTILSNTTSRKNLVSNVVSKAIALGIDGINIDFETIGSESAPHFIQFLRELSVECRKNELILSVDNKVPLNSNNLFRFDIQGQVADYVILMGYDEHWDGCKEAGSVASIDFVAGGLDRVLEHVPSAKVVNALPLYTILWKTQGADVTDDVITYRNVADFLSRVNAQYEWDEVTCQNYAEWDSGSTHYQIWIEDEESISVKLNVMKARELGGVAVWRLGYGNDAVWQLISAYAGS